MGAGCRRRRVRRVVLVGLATALLAGCTYADDEPGLFGQTPDAEPTVSRTGPARPASQAAIPVLGEAVRTGLDQSGAGIRFAVHGVRRVPGGTVLDWSITALSGPSGGQVADGVRLDLDEVTDVALVDAAAGRVYRPLVARDGARRCLCTPAARAAEDLDLNRPRLLQVAFPALPVSARVIDVVLAPVPVFTRIPIAPLGQVAAPITETDLARPVEEITPQGRTPYFALPGGQQFVVVVHEVLTSARLTSVVWTLQAMADGPGPEPGVLPVLTRNDAWELRPLRVRSSGPGGGTRCLCSDPSRWREGLTVAGGSVTLATTFGEVPRGATRVDLLVPGAPPLRDIRVAPASDGALRAAGTTKGPRSTWRWRATRPQSGWALTNWPTPTPEITEGDFAVTVDRILA